jgi:hypothetical protein
MLDRPGPRYRHRVARPSWNADAFTDHKGIPLAFASRPSPRYMDNRCLHTREAIAYRVHRLGRAETPQHQSTL